jgi:hypothetical protein
MHSLKLAASALIALSLISCESSSQDNTTKVLGSTGQVEDQTFYLGRTVTRPEELSGIWEAPDGHGGAIGIYLTLDAAAPVDATTLVGTPQTWLHLQVALYQRAGAVAEFSDSNGFSDSPRGGGARYESGRLTLHYGEVDLDLSRIAGDRWSGRVHRNNFDSKVILTRPRFHMATDKAWFVGTWESGNGPSLTCLHIAELAPAKFIGWSDTLLAWGSTRFSPHAAKPPYSLEHYGELAKVQAVGNQNVLVELYAYTGICCSHAFIATPVNNGAFMRADWGSGLNQAPHKTQWKKMPVDSCLVRTP